MRALPDVEDEHVGADEEQDERLDHQRQVAGELRREDRRVEAARRGAVDERAEEQRGEADADRGVAAEQRDGDADEADVRHLDVEHAEPVLPAEDVDRAAEPGERAGDRHRVDVVARDVDAAVARGLGVEADGAHLVAERRAVEDHPEDDERAERDEEADVERLELRVAPEVGSLPLGDDVVRDRAPRRRRCSAAGRRGRTR